MKRIGIVALAFACLFTASAVTQYLFVKQRLVSTAISALEEWANQIEREIVFRDKWDLDGFRHADILAPNFSVLTSDGFLIEVEGFFSGLLPPAQPIDPSVFVRPDSVKTEVGETHRVFGKRLEDGAIWVSVLDFDNQLRDLAAIDDLLFKTASKFGPNVAQALKVNTRDIDSRIDYAIVAANGEIEFAIGNPPLKLQGTGKLATSQGTRWTNSDGKKLLVYQRPILSSRFEPVGEIVLPKDFTAEERALHQTILFSLCLALGSWLIAVTLLVVPLVRYELEKRSLEISLEEALKKGEGQSIEFKAGVIDSNVAKVIAAFANTNAGNVFIGVEDNGGVSGLREQTAQERDQLLRKIRQVTTMIQPPVSPAATFLPHDGKTVLRLFVAKGSHPLYVLQGTIWVRRLAEVVSADRQEIIERALRARKA